MVTDTALPTCDSTSVRYYRPADPVIAAEFDSFIALLPQLRESHGGEYVAVCRGGIVASGIDLDSVMKQAIARVGADPYYCGWVEPVGGYVFRVGSPSVLPEAGSR